MTPLGSNLKHSLWTQEQFRCVLDDFIPSLSSVCSTTLNSQNKTVRQMQWPPFINEETNRKVKNIFQRCMTRNLTHLNSNPTSLSLNQAFLSLTFALFHRKHQVTSWRINYRWGNGRSKRLNDFCPRSSSSWVVELIWGPRSSNSKSRLIPK